MLLPNSNDSFEIILIGDTGNVASNNTDKVLKMLKAHLNPEQESAIIFLGDNVYPRGLPEKGNLLRKGAEAILKAHYEILKDYHGKVIFISGNHDWNKGRDDGFEYVIRQEKYIEKLFKAKNVFLPSNGCPGPTEININQRVTAVLINTQWWMQKGFRPIGKQCGCRVSSEEEFFNQLVQILDENKDKHVLVCGHHPVYSYAIHGGRFKLRHHLFPLTIFNEKAYIPIPIIGSLLPLYRKLLGATEDMSHPRYRRLRHQLKDILGSYNNLIYAAGHEHNLQHICKNGNHYLVSGAGSKLKYIIQDGTHLKFGIKAKGFFKLKYDKDGSVFTSAWVIDAGSEKGKLVYEKQLV